MSRAKIALVTSHQFSEQQLHFAEKLSDHNAVIQGYEDTFFTRNLSERTVKANILYIKGWFEGVRVKDETHPEGERQLMIWEAMEPIRGRERIINFSKGLCLLELQATTRRRYLGILRRLFGYVLEWPYIPGSLQHIASKYGLIEQPVLSYDYPIHVVDQEEEGFALIGDDLLNFYNFVRTDYMKGCQKKLTASRDYTMVVLGGESGLRANELRNLDALGAHRDLFYAQSMLQTRSGKAAKGSGSRTRKTVFTELAQHTTRAYEERIRPRFPNSDINPALFMAETGERISYNAMQVNLKRIVKAAREAGLDLPPVMGWHSLRKSFATNYLDQYPERIWELMQLLGHINPNSIHCYIKFGKGHMEQAINSMFRRLLPPNIQT